MNKNKKASRTGRLALGAVMAAAGTALMLLSGAVPVFTYAAPLLASLFLCPVCSRAGNRIAAAVWVITAGFLVRVTFESESWYWILPASENTFLVVSVIWAFPSISTSEVILWKKRLSHQPS